MDSTGLGTMLSSTGKYLIPAETESPLSYLHVYIYCFPVKKRNKTKSTL